MALSAKEISYGPFGRVLALTDGVTELYVTLDFGPRIIRYALVGGGNFMFEDGAGEIVEKGPAFDEYFYKGAYWRTYGGHRIWLTPEAKPETYYPDNDPVEYELSGEKVTFTPPPQKSNNVQERLILEYADGAVKVTAQATNIAETAQRFGVWQITVMCEDGLAVVPQNIDDTVLLSNRTMTLWPYCDMSDERVCWGKTLISLKQIPGYPNPFKFGTSNNRGFCAYLCHGAMFVKRFDWLDGVSYPDGGCNFETYTNKYMLELESLGGLNTVSPGDTLSQTEVWSITGGISAPGARDMAALEALVGEHIEK